MIGKILLHRYCFLEKLSSHRNTISYLVRDLNLQLLRIIKVFPSTEHHEFDSYQKLSHPMIPTLCDYFSDSGYNYLILEYINGFTIKEFYCKYSPKNIDFLPFLAFSLSSVFCYLHSLSPPLLYCDCKPENILISKRGFLYLTDFGSALSNPYSADFIEGTRGYASPEQFFGFVSKASDIYSFGKTFLFLSTFTSVSPSFSHLLQQCCFSDPSLRIPDFTTLSHSLSKLLPNLADTRESWYNFFLKQRLF